MGKIGDNNGVAGKRRGQVWFAVFALGVGGLLTALGGLHLYMTATAETWHPSPSLIPSVRNTAPLPEWTALVQQAAGVVRTATAEQNLPGVSVAVGVKGEVIWAEGFGLADVETHARVDPDTRFRLGTASIPLTAAGVGLLLEDGRLDLSRPIQTWVPEFPVKAWPVTLRDLMSHQSGLRNDGGDEGPFDEQCARAVDALPLFADTDLLFEPGTRYRFSSFGWALTSAAIEQVADEPLERFLRDRVFEPLGMRNTRQESLTTTIPDRATFYFPRYAADPRHGLHLMRPVDFSCFAGAMAFLSTPTDLVRFGMGMLGGSLLTPETVAALTTPQQLRDGTDTGYGLGWDVETFIVHNQPVRWVGHEGATLGGAVVSLVVVPEHSTVVAVATNISWADVEGIALAVARLFIERG